MEADVARRLRDMLRHIDGALETVGEADFESYQNSFVMRMTAERCIEIVSEASKHVPDSIKSSHPEIPWPQVRAIGNVLRHAYSTVDDRVIWRTVKTSLPQLRVVVAAVLEQYRSA